MTPRATHIAGDVKESRPVMVVNFFSVSLLTWVVMPVVIRSSFGRSGSGWLPSRDVAVAASIPPVRRSPLPLSRDIAFLLWLITTHIWHLP